MTEFRQMIFLEFIPRQLNYATSWQNLCNDSSQQPLTSIARCAPNTEQESIWQNKWQKFYKALQHHNLLKTLNLLMFCGSINSASHINCWDLYMKVETWYNMKTSRPSICSQERAFDCPHQQTVAYSVFVTGREVRKSYFTLSVVQHLHARYSSFFNFLVNISCTQSNQCTLINFGHIWQEIELNFSVYKVEQWMNY